MLSPFLEIGVLIGLSSVLGLLVYLHRLSKNNNKKRRRSDKGLTKQERRIFDQAKLLFSKGKHVEAAQMLDSIGLTREAINLLQDSGHIDEAADILLRMKLPNRAGVIYTRHGKWEKAMECFKMANMPLEVARCARETSDFATAASYYLKAERYTEAADCFKELGDQKRAARLYAKAGRHSKAINQYLALIETEKNPANILLDSDELDYIVEAVSRGNAASSLARVLATNERLTDAMINLVRFGNIPGAAKLYSFANDDIDHLLIEALSTSENATKDLAELFRHLNKPDLAAKLTGQASCTSKDDPAEETNSDSSDFEDESRDLVNATMALTKSRLLDENDDGLGNRGGNLPNEKYKVKAAKENTDTITQRDSLMDDVFSRSKILYDLKKDEKRQIWQLGESLIFEPGDVLLQPNQTPRGIFFVLSGSISVFVGPNSNNENRREVYPGETFAAHWVFLDELTEAKFTAKETTEVRVVTKENLQSLLDNNGTLARKLYKNMTRQIRFDFLTTQNDKSFHQAS